MKKIYSKPEIAFESFSMSTNIAAGCEQPTNLPSNNECGLDFSGVYIFLDTMSGCVEKVPSDGGDGEWNTICYHVPDGGKNNLFTS